MKQEERKKKKSKIISQNTQPASKKMKICPCKNSTRKKAIAEIVVDICPTRLILFLFKTSFYFMDKPGL